MVITFALPDHSVAQQHPETRPFEVESHQALNAYHKPPHRFMHTPLETASRPWLICVIVPHFKDAYWLDAYYGMVEEAKRLQVGVKAIDSGGYFGIDRQIAALAACRDMGAHAIVLGSVSYNNPRLLQSIEDMSSSVPVIASVNDLVSPVLAAKVGVSWRQMGYETGAVLAKRHPSGSAKVTAVIATGPRDAGWVQFLSEGLRAALAGSSVEIVAEDGADSDTFAQYSLVERLLASHPKADYLIGTAPAIESALSLTSTQTAPKTMQFLATYYTGSLRRAMQRGLILAAPYDAPILQGRLSLEYAVRAIEHKIDYVQIGPRITVTSQSSLPPLTDFAPAGFEPAVE